MDELSALSRDLGVQAPTALPLSSSSSSATTSAASSGSLGNMHVLEFG